MTQVQFTRCGNGSAGLVIEGEFKGWFGGTFDALRSIGARHPLDWGDKRWVQVGALGVHHPVSGATA